MATKTLNYNLTLPEDNEPADQNVFNENFEIIDGVLKELDTTKQAALSASQLEATNSGITNAELVELVDNGAKNLINNTAVSTSYSQCAPGKGIKKSRIERNYPAKQRRTQPF